MGIPKTIINKSVNKASPQSNYNSVTKGHDDHGKDTYLPEHTTTQTS